MEGSAVRAWPQWVLAAGLKAQPGSQRWGCPGLCLAAQEKGLRMSGYEGGSPLGV